LEDSGDMVIEFWIWILQIEVVKSPEMEKRESLLSRVFFLVGSDIKFHGKKGELATHSWTIGYTNDTHAKSMVKHENGSLHTQYRWQSGASNSC